MLTMSTCEMGGIPLEGVDFIADAVATLNETYNKVHPFIAVFLCVAGTIMNMITVAVLTRPSMLSPINLLLCAVALCDIVVMSSLFLFVTHFLIAAPTRCDVNDYSHSWSIFLFVHAQTTVVFHATSIWLTVLLAQIRVLTIRRATRAPTEAIGPKATICLALLTLSLVIAVNVPNFLTFEIVEIEGSQWLTCMQRPEGGDYEDTVESTVVSTSQLSSHNDNTTSFVYHIRANVEDCALLKLAFWTNGLLFKVVPCALLTVSIIALLKIISDVADRRKSLAQVMNKKRMPRDHTTPMLVAVLSIFLFAELPQGLLHLGNAIYSNETFYQKIYINLGDLMDLLSLLNSAVNFIIYCAMSRKFRVVFLQLMHPCLPRCILVRIQDQLSVGDVEASRSHRPSGVTDLTKTEQLALTSHRPSATSMLIPNPSNTISNSYGESMPKGPLLSVPCHISPRVSFDHRSKPLDGRSSLEIHELTLSVPRPDESDSRPFLSLISPFHLLRRLYSLIRSHPPIHLSLDTAKEPTENTPLPCDSSPVRRLSIMRIELNQPPGY